MTIPDLTQLARAIDQCMLRDQQELQTMLRTAKRRVRSGQPADQLLGKLRRKLKASNEVRAKRLDALPKPLFPFHLPVVEKKDEIAAAIRDNQVIVLCGETGSGKTTQLPKICLELGRGVAGMIGHTQPRRIAARSTAARIAEELNSPVGKYVGYKIRFGDTVSDGSYVKIMTDGILLAETRSDPLFHQYDTIIIDEAHERSLNIDFLLGYIKRILPKRPDLKLIITSATIDPERFSKHFDGAPIVEVSGRMYPVEVRFRPLQTDNPEEADHDLRQGVLKAVDEASYEGAGDILVFLSGEREIRDIAGALRGHVKREANLEVLPLFARLSTTEQNRVFQPHRGRRIVLATNVAETSLTVPGIRYVIDGGMARISRYSARSSVQRLPIEPISQASAEQRKGRCGRVSEGICFRLYSEEDYAQREEYTPPEVLRSNLASVILQMKSLNLGEVRRFPFIDPPRASMIREGEQTLFELGAIDEQGRVTDIGRSLARLPIDPRLGRMILAANVENCLTEVLVIAAALSIQDPRERPHESRDSADEAHAQWADEHSDFLTLLNLWRFYREQSKKLSQNQLRKLCRTNHLSFIRMREWHEVHRQLRELIRESELPHGKINREPAPEEAVHRAVLAGLISRIGRKGDSHEYTGAHNRKFFLFPGSAVFRSAPRWVVAAELIETTKLYAHTVARIQPEWVEHIAEHLVSRRYSEPHWREKQQDIGAFERVSLFGLELVSRRGIAYGPIDPVHARELFIQHALVEGQLRTNAPFMQHNRKLIEEIITSEDKLRRRGLLVDDSKQFAFFDQYIPPGIFNRKQFERWRKKAEKKSPQLLFMSRSDLLTRGASEAEGAAFPDHLDICGVRLPLEYRFEPGHERDGVTITVPQAMLAQLPAHRLEWLVPGLFEEKVTELIRSLPKSIRRNVVPAPQYAAACLDSLTFGEGSLQESLARQLRELSGVEIDARSFDPSLLREYLHMRIRVVDDDGREVAAGRDLAALREAVLAPRQEAKTQASHVSEPQIADDREYHVDGLRGWPEEPLPHSVTINRAGIDIPAYPALVDQQNAVGVRVFDSSEAAHQSHHAGVRRLIMLSFSDECQYLADEIPGGERLAMIFTSLGHGDGGELREQIVARIVDETFLNGQPEIRTREMFELRITTGWHGSQDALDRICQIVNDTLERQQMIALKRDALRSPDFEPSLADIDAQLTHLMPRGFLLSTPMEWLQHLPRYLQGVLVRLEKLLNGRIQRDRELMATFEPWWTEYLERRTARDREGVHDPHLDRFRWLLEEYRVALFAQELGTAVRVSPKRLEAERTNLAR